MKSDVKFAFSQRNVWNGQLDNGVISAKQKTIGVARCRQHNGRSSRMSFPFAFEKR